MRICLKRIKKMRNKDRLTNMAIVHHKKLVLKILMVFNNVIRFKQ